jgi:hypothetical protein
MREAIERATLRLARLTGSNADPSAWRHAVIEPGLKAVTDAVACYRDGGQFASHDEAAWLALGLLELRVRDDAWSRMIPEYNQAHQRLWTDLTRLATGRYVTAPASLLAFTAWQSGNGALAVVALDRALAAGPGYSMAVLLRDPITSGMPLSAMRPLMTPEQVAESYDHVEDKGRNPAAGGVQQHASPGRRRRARPGTGSDLGGRRRRGAAP